MNYTSLLKTLRQYIERGGVGDETVEYQMPLIINRVERSLADKLKIQGYRYVLTSNVVQMQPVIAKPEGWRNTVSINIGIGPTKNQRRVLRSREYEYMRALYPDDTKLDAPVFYCDYDQEHWLVAPCPDNTYPFEAIVYRLPDLLGESNQQNYLTQFVPNMLLYECLKALEPFIKNDARMMTWKALADDEFNNVKAQDMMKATDRAQLRGSS
jgi:hypothetical protein